MQLLYLWIEDYKNIKQQGFNFSPLYDFHFEPDKPDENGKIVSGTLTDNIKDKDRKKKAAFYEDFFNVKNEKDKEETQKGKITNVTAIVGENGAGKSSVLDGVKKLGAMSPKDLKDCIVIVNDGNKVYKILTNIEVSGIVNNKLLDGLHIINYSYSLDDFYKFEEDIRDKRPFAYTDTSINNLFHNINIFDKHRKVSLQHYIDVQNHFWFWYISEFANQTHINFNGIAILFKGNNSIDFRYEITKSLPIREVVSYSQEEEIEEHFYRRLYIEIITSLEIFFGDLLEPWQKNIVEKNKLSDNILFLQILFNEITKSDNTYKKLIRSIYQKYKVQNLRVKQDFHFLESISQSEKLLDILKKANFKDNRYFIINIQSELFNRFVDIDSKILFRFHSLQFTYKNNICYFSYGEKTLLNLFSGLWQARKANSSRGTNICILIDEGELGLHPQWQKQYLKILLETLPKIFPDKEIQLILTSHSPFLVSDLPKENVIFLEKEKDTGLCKVSKLESMKHTFGANIHTLLTDSFFMKGGLVGEFAQSKIDEAIDILNESEPKPKELDKCEMIISMIGEPIVKTMLQKLLDSKRLRKVDKHSTEIEELKARIHSLESILKNDNPV
ncbi:AAA family ATPase [Bernardetia sp. MNP-M8]|uniref:AAA family ATPase n=1 Tax=Bernardetia sp. MNP-M8 TaxID=3127470 RepID=UPI0030CA9970